MGDFKHLTAENYAAFRQHYISTDAGTLTWPTIEELIEHARTRNRDGSNVQYASDTELQQRFARLDTRYIITPCENKIVSVIIDVVTLFFGGRELMRHRTFKQLEVFFIHADLPLRDASRCLNVLHFGNEVPYFTKAAAILRLLKFVFKGGVSATIWAVWGIIVKNLSWKDLILYGIEIGSEWIAFFATDGAAGFAMVVQELVRGTWFGLDLSEMIACIKNDGSIATSPSKIITKNNKFGMCVTAIDFPKPNPQGGYLPKSNSKNPDYWSSANTLQLNKNAQGILFLNINGSGAQMASNENIAFQFVPPNKLLAPPYPGIRDEIFDGCVVTLKADGQGESGLLSKAGIEDHGFQVPQSFQAYRPGGVGNWLTWWWAPERYHFIIRKVNRVEAAGLDFIHDQDQIQLEVAIGNNSPKGYFFQKVNDSYLGIIYDERYPSHYYIGITRNPQVWTVFKTPFNP